MAECKWGIDESLDAFLVTLDEASKAYYDINEKQAMLFKTIAEIRDNTVPENYEEILNEIMSGVKEEGLTETLIALHGVEEVFSPSFDYDRWLSSRSRIHGEETDADKLNTKERTKLDFLKEKFKGKGSTIAERAALYFLRDAKNKLLEAFAINRSLGYLVSEEDIPKNVRALKQSLVDTIVDYLKTVDPETYSELEGVQLFNAYGEYIGTFSENSLLFKGILKKLTIDTSFRSDTIANDYEAFKSKQKEWETSKQRLEAYNAAILLSNFDDITTMLLGNIVKPMGIKLGHVYNLEYMTKFNKDTNMWGNGYGDENENIADIVSDVTKLFIQTSKMYTWKGPAIEDSYLTFLDFNYILTKVKKFAHNPISKTIILNEKFVDKFDSQISEESKRTINELRKLRISLGLDPDPTFQDVVSFISDNPQRHLHTIFDLLCNTNILNKYPEHVNLYDKNLIWTLGKEIFGSWNNQETPSRSLYDLHNNSNNDRIFEIVTLLADSMFAEEFLQFYEDNDGLLKTRLLQDYAIQLVKSQLLYSMKETSGLFDPTKFTTFITNHGIKIENSEPRPVVGGFYKFVKSVKIPINDNLSLEYDGNSLKINKPNLTGKKFQNFMESVWKDTGKNSFKLLIFDAIGIDFKTNVELAQTYEELFRQFDTKGNSLIQYAALIEDISRIVSLAVFNLAFNNIIVPNILTVGNKGRTRSTIVALRGALFSSDNIPNIDPNTGVVELLSIKNKDGYLRNLSIAKAATSGLLTSAQVKTGENTALANQCLSCLRSSYIYQILTLNRNKLSATKNLSFIDDKNNLFLGVIKMREYNSKVTNKVNTSMSAVELFHASFIGGFVSAFTSNSKREAFFIPAVYSDKTTSDILKVNLNAKGKIHKNKSYYEMTDSELEDEMRGEFGPMYTSIIENINRENTNFALLLGISLEELAAINNDFHPVEAYQQILNRISDVLCSSDVLLDKISNKKPNLSSTIENLRKENKSSKEIVEILESMDSKTVASIRKNEILELMHAELTRYNMTHRRNPIEICELIHYIWGKDGRLTTNKTLTALWGRFQGNQEINEKLGITKLYPEDRQDANTANGFFKYEKDIRTAQELLEGGFELYLYGNKANPNQAELEVLRQYKDWITKSGKMAIAKIFKPSYKYNVGDIIGDAKIVDIKYYKGLGLKYRLLYNTSGITSDTWLTTEALDESISAGIEHKPIPLMQRKGTYEIISDPKILQEYFKDPELRKAVLIHPMLSKVNRLYYLTAQQYMSSVGGAHFVYKGGDNNVLVEEAKRWLASNKRNVCYPSTVHKFQNKTLYGVPKYYQIAPLEDIKSTVYSIMGDIDSHKPIDGGMFVNPWFSILENNALGGEAAGLDKKQFGTYYYERYAAGGIIKTAGFALTNQRMRNSLPYRNLCKNMTDRVWIKEYANENGEDIEEFLDITRDYYGNPINWVNNNGQETYYEREYTTPGKHKGFRKFKLAHIAAIYSNGNEEIEVTGKDDVKELQELGFKPTNRYKIYEYPVNDDGTIDTSVEEIASQLKDKDINNISPILRTDDANPDGTITINTNYKLYNYLFGGCNSLSRNENGKLKYSENSIILMVHALNNVGYVRTKEYDSRYDALDITKVKDLDDVWLPLKYSDISYAPNIGALKSTQMNVNPKEGMYEERDLNSMTIMMALLGIQLDKEHHADDSEVSMPTLIILACANKGYTIHYTDKLYGALSNLTELAIEDCMAGILEYMPGNVNKGTLLTEVSTIIVDKLIHSLDDNEALEAVMAHLILKAESGLKINSEDVIGKTAFSDSGVYNKIYSDLASHLTNSAIKMKFPGTLAVICPTEKMEQMYGKRRLSAYRNSEKEVTLDGELVKGVSELLGVELHQLEIRENVDNKYDDLVIYDVRVHEEATVEERLSIASKLDTLHHYWVEYVDSEGLVFKESITINTPKDYYKLKEELAYQPFSKTFKNGEREIHATGVRITNIYENITKGRELGAFNSRFEARIVDLNTRKFGLTLRFNIFDIDSVKTLFEFDDLPKNLDTAIELLNDNAFVVDSGSDEKQKELNKIITSARHLLGHLRDAVIQAVKRLLVKESPSSYELISLYPNVDIIDAVKIINDSKVTEDFVNAVFKISKVFTYKIMEKDLFKVSKDYKGPRNLWINGEIRLVNPSTITTLAYELIMPKVYQSKFGLEEGDQVSDIIEDPEFFYKRGLNKIKKLHVASSCFHYELKKFNGKHIYIWDSKLGDPNPEIFREKRIDNLEISDGVWERKDLASGETIYSMSSSRDKVMTVGDLGYEVIVTDNPEFYFENLDYNIVTFSNDNVQLENLELLVSNLSDSKNRAVKSFIRSVSKKGELFNFKFLKKRNQALANLTLDTYAGDSREIASLKEWLIDESKKLHASFNKSLDIIAGRIPAQSLQSFMPQRVVAFDNNNINTAYVSTFQLFLLGSKYINKN